MLEYNCDMRLATKALRHEGRKKKLEFFVPSCLCGESLEEKGGLAKLLNAGC